MNVWYTLYAFKSQSYNSSMYESLTFESDIFMLMRGRKKHRYMPDSYFISDGMTVVWQRHSINIALFSKTEEYSLYYKIKYTIIINKAYIKIKSMQTMQLKTSETMVEINVRRSTRHW